MQIAMKKSWKTLWIFAYYRLLRHRHCYRCRCCCCCYRRRRCRITHRILGEYPNNCAWQKDNRANCLFTVSYGCYLKPNSMYHLAVVVFPFGANALFVVFLSVCEFIVSGIRNLIAVPDCSSVIPLVVESYTSSLQRSYSVHRAFQCEWQIFLTSLVF